MTRVVVFAAAALLVGLAGACGSSDRGNGFISGSDGGGDDSSTVMPGDDASMRHDGETDADAAPIDASVSNGPCFTIFRFVPPAGTTPHAVSVSGEWNSFSTPGTAMAGPDATGAYTAQVQLAPGLVAYKLIVDGTWQLDPNEHWQKFVGGIANSAVQVANCHLPTLALTTNAVARPVAGQGHYTATVAFHAGEGAPPIEPSSVKATLRKDHTTTSVVGVTVDVSHSTIAVDVPSLADGKYSVFVTAKDYAGQSTQSLRLVLWVEAAPFEWSDSVIYMAMTDRFRNGDTSNDPPATTMGGGDAGTVSVDPREDYHGGDLAGAAQVINGGYLDRLGARVLWLSPFNTNPTDAWAASDGVHMVTGYHGYWPTKAREVDPRWGGASALHAMVTAAHAHGIRVLMDLVVQHVHQEHEYLAQHPDWFNTTGCICGTSNCDWTVHRLDCLFTSYLPNIDWTSAAGAAQWEADAVWWLDSFDLDGFRLDAVKQVPDIAVINLSSAVRDEFEPSGTKLYMIGETAMGWVDNNLQDNLSQYQLISQYVQDGLDGQFDFVLYYADPINVFANRSYGLDHADYWTQASGWEYPQGSIMGPYIGSEDSARFITIASYRGQDTAHDGSIPYNQWTNIAGPPPDSETYGRHRDALAWLLGQPGAPMVYYGDEYGQWGGVDPNNRADWRGDTGNLTSDEQTTLAFTQKLGQARRDLVAMRRGDYVPVYNTSADVVVFARQTAAGDVALGAISRLDSPTQVTASLPASLNLSGATTLHDHMGGPDVQVTGSTITLSLGAQGAAILAP